MHLIWDWNGTLLDDLHVVVDAVNASLRTIDAVVQIDADGYRDHYRRPVRGFYDAMLDRAVTDAEWERINTRFHEVYLELLPGAGPAADAHDAVAYARSRGASQSILSMWTHEQLVPTVAGHGLDAAMVAVRGAVAAEGESKVELLRHHLDELGLDPQQRIVLIGDTFDDAVAAQEVGAAAVFYDGGSHHRHHLEATGVPVADTLIEAIDIAAKLNGRR